MQINKIIKLLFFISLLLSSEYVLYPQASAGIITGTVTEKSNGLPLPGVNVSVDGTFKGTVTDTQGQFTINDIEPGNYSLTFSFISYEPLTIRNAAVLNGKQTQIDAALSESAVLLNDVVVVAARKTDSEISILNQVKNSPAIVNGISAQIITRSQDANASEVVKKSPGISIVDDRFIIVRGLSQRYNNVWLNNTPVPGTETDSRAFAFDLIPASQIDNLLVYKSPSPELPADFSGGFVKIATKSKVESNFLSIQYGTAFLQGTTFKSIELPEGSSLDYLGLGSGKRSLPVNFPENLKNVSLSKSVSFTKVMDNDWTPANNNALPDQKLSLTYSHSFPLKGVRSIDNLASVNYGISSRRMEISSRRYGIFDLNSLTSSLYNDFADIKNTRDVKLAVLYNWAFNLSENFKLEVRNLYNQFGQSSYTTRTGKETYSGEYEIKSYSDQYFTRSVYSGQLAGQIKGDRGNGLTDWTLGYARSSRNAPDRRIVTARRNMDYDESSSYGNFRTESNDIRRLFQKLGENSFNGSLDYKLKIPGGKIFSSFNTGWYGEYRERSFSARSFAYDTGNGLSSSFYNLAVREMLTDQYINEDGIYIYETSNKSDSYSANNQIQAFYVSVPLKLGSHFSVNAGIRAEYNKITLSGYESDGIEQVNVSNEDFDIFPSLNSLVTLNDHNQFRFAYGRSINRPELREIAPYVFYDFDAFSYIEGNPRIKNAYIDNIEFRYEFYPQNDELITAGIFYKSFNSPVEMTYYETGGNLQYTYTNAKSASARGVELEIRKSLDFTGITGFALMFNASWIYSRVHFSDEGIEKDRAMQGQSPYLLNTGLFYTYGENRFTAGITYNCIGKRIFAVGQVYQNDYESIPDIYEIPGNLLNLSASTKIGKRMELSFTVKNILNEITENRQYINFSTNEIDINQTHVTKSFRPGRYFGLTMGIKI